MNASGWIQLALYIVVLLLITKPLGLYLVQVLDANGRTFLDPVLKPVERLTYRIFGVDPEKEQGWVHYSLAILMFSMVTMIFTYVLLRTQNVLPLNPQKLPAVA
ncbi:MAG TPA: potassium-transporting ATPase subunit KdpA, partial [Chthoniobacterales bacterium]